MKKLVIGIFIVVVLATGLILGLFFVQRSAIFKEKASSGGGTATVSISPATGTFQVNTPNTVSVYFNPNNTLISGIAVELSFSSLSVHASNIKINPALINQGNQNDPNKFTCLIQSVSTDPNQPSTTLVDISCIIPSPISEAPGFTANTDTLLGTFDLTADAIPLENPLKVSFNAGPTKIISRADASDIALTPSSTGSYTFTDTNVSPSPTNPGGTTTPTPTPTATSADVPTVTPTPTATSTTISYATVTPAPTSTTFAGTAKPTAVPIPVTGFDTPTIIALVAGGILLLLGSLALIL